MQLRTVAPVLGLLASSCSTLAPKPVPTACSSSADCPEDRICDMSGFCVRADDPPALYVGFRLEAQTQGAAGYRAEVAGCDVEVDINASTGVQAIELQAEQVTRFFDLRVFRPTATNFDNPTLEDMLLATFRLTQGSRFTPEQWLQTADAPATEGEDVIATRIAWPRYHPSDATPALPEHLGPTGHILWRIEPTEEVGEHIGNAAPVYINLTPPYADGFAPEHPMDPKQRACTDDLQCCAPEAAACEPIDVDNACIPPEAGVPGVTSGVCRSMREPVFVANYAYRAECDRLVTATVFRVDPETLQPQEGIAGAVVSLRHADKGANRIGLPAFGAPWPPEPEQCQGDLDCIDSQFCNSDTSQCEVRLAGLEAASGATSEEVPGQLSTRVFTYCDPETPPAPLDRAFTVRVAPLDSEGLPAMTYDVEVSFDPAPNQDPPTDLGDGKLLCIPDLGLLEPIPIVAEGSPARLLTSGPDTYSCCNLDCLPTTATATPPVAPSSCGVAGVSITATAPVAIADEDLEAWVDSQCVLPTVDDDGNVGVLSRTAMCPPDATDDQSCTLEVPLEHTRHYDVRVIAPTGSVLQSVDTTIDVPLDTSTPVRIALPQRPIVRGRVMLSSDLCDPAEEDDGDCGSEGAQILAERLRVDNETTTNTPGPYFHQVATFHDPEVGDGAYVLPLDPGVWIMTALPDPGTAGGPSAYSRVDLDEGVEEFEQPFTLEPGVLVTLDLATFDRRSLVTPLDIGSWRFQTNLLHPDRGPPNQLLDLMAEDECLTEGTRGCTIRRLVTGTGLSLTQVGQVRFTARDLGGQAAQVCTEVL